MGLKKRYNILALQMQKKKGLWNEIVTHIFKLSKQTTKLHRFSISVVNQVVVELSTHEGDTKWWHIGSIQAIFLHDVYLWLVTHTTIIRGLEHWPTAQQHVISDVEHHPIVFLVAG